MKAAVTSGEIISTIFTAVFQVGLAGAGVAINAKANAAMGKGHECVSRLNAVSAPEHAGTTLGALGISGDGSGVFGTATSSADDASSSGCTDRTGGARAPLLALGSTSRPSGWGTSRRPRAPRPVAVRDAATAPFCWSLLQSSEKRAMLLLAGSGALEYLLFATTTLLWINWFDAQFGSLALAVMLASIYGPFQVVGRVLEMKAGHHLDARLTGLIAAFLVPVSLILVQIQTIPMAVLAMALFGMGHGVLTVSFGFVTNLYFRAEIYGRAKGIIATPRAFGAAIGPGVGGLLFGLGSDIYMGLMIALSAGATVLFASLLLLTPTNEVHAGNAR